MLLEKQETGIKATTANCQQLWKIGLNASLNNEPTILGEIDGIVVGFVLWAGVCGDLEVTERLCMGYGTYVLPEFRRLGVSKELRKIAITEARNCGFGVVQGVAYDAVGLKTALKMGFEKRGTLVEFKL